MMNFLKKLQRLNWGNKQKCQKVLSLLEKKKVINKPVEQEHDDEISDSETASSSSESSVYYGEPAASEVKFSAKQYKTLKPVLHNYYAVDFVNKSFVGRVVTVGKTKVTMTFLERKSNDEYHWPVRVDKDDVYPQALFCGPIKLSGTIPFTIHGIDKAFSDYKKNLANR